MTYILICAALAGLTSFSLVDGQNACPAGTYGPNCTLPCPDKCGLVNGFKTCDQNTGTCYTCVVGWHGTKCTSFCNEHCRDGCDKSNSYCTGCVTGRFGTSCTSQCNEHCIGGCDRSSGYCRNCTTGWYGHTCSNPCSQHCNGGCTNINGYCTSCVFGYYTTQCSSVCPAFCIGGCKMSNGYCTECPRNRYGSTCDGVCSTNCAPFPTDNRTCDVSSGSCPYGCITGFYNSQCSSRCPAFCIGGCTMSNGYCTECPQNRYGPICDGVCSVNCAPSPTNNRTCNVNSGSCSYGCVTGWYGTFCTSQCNDHCVGGCDRNSGYCKMCGSGRYGPRCDSTCPQYCEDECERDTGYCSRCMPGWYGRKCDVPCGDSCVSSDGKRTCDRISGECTLRSDFGQTAGSPGSWNHTGAIVGAVFGAAVLLGIFVIIAVFIWRRLPSSKSQKWGQRSSFEENIPTITGNTSQHHFASAIENNYSEDFQLHNICSPTKPRHPSDSQQCEQLNEPNLIYDKLEMSAPEETYDDLCISPKTKKFLPPIPNAH